MAFRPVLKTLHIWTGIASGLFISVVALTGSVILFRGEFERVALPPHSVAGASSRVSIDAAAREIARVRPDARVRRVQIPGTAETSYIFQIQSAGKGTERIVSDSATGQMLGTIQPNWMDWMVDLHRNLLSGAAGRSVVGVIGVILFALSITGLLMWLSGTRSWCAWTSVRRRGSGIRFNYELHRASGLWAYAFLAMISLTGTELAFPNFFRQTVQSLTGKPATVPTPKSVHGSTALRLDEYVRLGRAAMPDGVPVELRLSDLGQGPVDLRLYRAGDLAPSGNHVYMNPGTGAVVTIDRIVDRPLGARLLAAMSPIHYAQFGGMPVKIAWALLGLAPALLFVTGILVWWRPRSKSRPRIAQSTESVRVASDQVQV